MMPWFIVLTNFARVAFPLPAGCAFLPPVTSFLQLCLILYFKDHFLPPRKICPYLSFTSSFFCLPCHIISGFVRDFRACTFLLPLLEKFLSSQTQPCAAKLVGTAYIYIL